ncbi:MAG TPA: glycosyltransferase [Solirubrobacteraceae bacterium]|nr:glycosyltransferase [Solirubrobacteraceae bacterium]
MTLPPGSIWLDAQGGQNRTHFDRGIPRYVNEQLRAIVDLAPSVVAGVGVNPALPLTGNLDWLLGSGRLEWNRHGPTGPAAKPQIYHVMSPIELDRSLDEIWPVWARVPGIKTVVTLFDLIPLIFEHHYLRQPQLRERYLARLELVRCADQVLALSQTTADDAIERLRIRPDRVTVVDAGVANGFAMRGDSVASRDRILGRFRALRPGFMLYVAGIEFRKNIERLIEAHGLTSASFRANHQLVITCRVASDERERLTALGRRAGLNAGDLLLTGYVDDLELAGLYRGCALFVFASFYEGSGLPVLEAMACGAPVAASNTSTSPEILGDRDATFDPFDPRDIARVLEATLGDADLITRLRERSRRRVARYTWRHVAERSLAGYRRALEGVGRVAPPRLTRRRLALFTPWPPDRSGIAGYNRRLVQELGRHVDVDVVVGGPKETYARPAEPGAHLVHIDDVGWQRDLRLYDRLVYCMGNSHFHGHVYKALQERRGTVIAHDVRLTGFYGWYSGTERPSDPIGRLGERIGAMYGDRVGTFDARPPTPSEQSALGIYMTHEIQEYADRLVVHSEYAADILRLDRPPSGPEAPVVTVVPLAFPDAPRRSAPRGVDPQAPLIASFGVVSSTKNPQVMIEAFALLAADRPGGRLVFLGGADPVELDRWRAVAAGAGVGDRVEIHGHASHREWDRLLGEADIALQLRLVSNGEASAAVADCMAAGLPVVVTDHGWFAELPDDAVVKVPVEIGPEDLAGAMCAVLDVAGRADQLASRAREHARANSFEAVAASYLEVLDLI